MMLPQYLAQHVEQLLGSYLSKTEPCQGGCISQAAVVSCADGSKCFVKWNFDSSPGMFTAEARGLHELGRVGALKVPEVMSVVERAGADEPAAIIMEALTPAVERTSTDSAALGRGLAKLHRHQAKNFGFESANHIGELPQYNDFAESWGEFFYKYRLQSQAEIATTRGWLDESSADLLKSKRESIMTALNEHSPTPSLLHGDLWSGNVFWSTDGPALIDPAVYYGCREADIGMTQCFGRFDQEFYIAYNEEFPLSEGFAQRIEILNLYHLMTHANMFGGGYASSAKQRLKEI